MSELADFMLGRTLSLMAALALLTGALLLIRWSAVEQEKMELRSVIDDFTSLLSSCGSADGNTSISFFLDEPAGAEIRIRGWRGGDLQHLFISAGLGSEVSEELVLPTAVNGGDFQISAFVPCGFLLESSGEGISLGVVR